MHNDGILQVSSISPLQAAVISPGMLHPPLGIPLSPHTQPGQDYSTAHSYCTNPPCTLRKPPRIHKLSAVYKTYKTLIVSKDWLSVWLELPNYKPQQIKCVSWDLFSVILYKAPFRAAWRQAGLLHTETDRPVTESSLPATASLRVCQWWGVLERPAHSQQVTLSALSSCNAEQKAKNP